MRAFCCVVAFFAVASHAALTLQTAGVNSGFGLSKVASNFPAGTPSAALPFINAAGVSKLMVAAGGNNYVINDVDGVDVMASLMSMPATATRRTSTATWEDLAVLGGNIYATDSSMGGRLFQLTSDGLPAGAALATIGTTNAMYGIVGNPTNGKLYIGTTSSVSTYDVLSASPTLTADPNAGASAPYQYRGVALAPNYQTFYAAVKDTALMSNDNNVEGFNILPGESVMVFQSSNVGDVKGVLAGTGCLADYIFVTSGSRIIQISFRGVQAIVAEDSMSGLGGYLSFDPKDGSMLVAWSDGVYRMAPPSCGGFAGPTKFVADALPMGSMCLVNYDCSSQNCFEGQCATNGYLGICQMDSDCDGPTTDGFFCQLPPAFRPNIGGGGDKKHHHDKKHNGQRFGFGDFQTGQNVWTGPGPNPALYGVCEINECVVNWGGCDFNAICTPTGDRQRVCSCVPGFFGTGIFGQCVNPCLIGTTNGGCFATASCNAVSATDVQCTCPTGFFGSGMGDEGCAMDPCNMNADCQISEGICTPTGSCNSCYTCDCLEGFFKVPNWVSGPQCAMDLCFDNGNGGPCPANSECTPAVASYSCTCNPGYTPGPLTGGTPDIPSYCTPAACPTLTPGTFLFPDIHSTMGTCAGAVTGESCFFGCSSGYKPKTSARATCIAGQTPGTAVFSFTPFQCEIDPDRHDDDHHDDHPHSPWWCGNPPVSPCLPSAPWLAWKDGNAGTLQLRWIPLGVSPLGDVVSSLQILVSPHGGLKYTTSPVPLPSSAHEITINGLNDGEIYTFRLYVLTQGGHQVTGLPLTVSL